MNSKTYKQPDHMYCGPTCYRTVAKHNGPPCAKTHKSLDDLLEQNSNVQAWIVFTASNTFDDIKTPVSRHLMALNDLADKTIIKNALNDRLKQKQKDYASWSKLYPVEINETSYYKLDKQQAWSNMADVITTLTLLLNGHRLPDLYQLPDLTYLLE